MNRECNLTKRVKTPHGLRYCRVALSANGRIKPDVVIVNGKEARHPEGAYYLNSNRSERIALSSVIRAVFPFFSASSISVRVTG